MTFLNPRRPSDAVKWAKRQADGTDKGWHGLCDHFAALCYGWGHSGDAYALITWKNGVGKHVGDEQPPAGALVCWSYQGTQHKDMGHIAISVGGGLIASTDVLTKGGVGIVPLAWFKKHWPSYLYLGWIQPQFKHPSSPIKPPKAPGVVA